MTSEPISLEAARKPFRREGLGYVWRVSQYDVELRADYIRLKFSDIYCQIAVTMKGKNLRRANFNISDTRDRSRLSRELNSLTNGLALTWDTIIENFCVGILVAEQEGGKTEYTQEAPKRHLNYLVDHLIMRGKSNMVFAPGGHGKGMLCVAICCALATSRGIGDLETQPAAPFYLDWEDDFDTFEDRLNAIARGFGIAVPRLPYRRMRGLASDRINEIARALAVDGSDFAVIDSFSAAGGTTSDKTSWDTIAHRLFDALDMIPGMTWLIVDHVTGDTMTSKQAAGKAYGSIQKMNRVRNAWELQSDQESGSPDVHMRFIDAKWNHRGKQPPFGLRMEFANDAVKFSSEDPVEALRANSNVADRMAFELAKGPLSSGVLAISMNVQEDTVRRTLNRNKDRFERDGPYIKLRQDWDQNDNVD